MAICADDDDLPLAAEFPATSQADWRKLVEAALKGASFDKRLVSQTYDGLRIEPLYPRAAGVKPVAGRTPGAAWTLMQRVDHPDPAAANAQALQDLQNGATGLTLVFAGSLNANGYGLDASPATLARALAGVELDAGITIDFNLSPATRTAVQHFAALVKARKLAPASVDMRASINPIGGFAASGATPMPWSELSKIFAANIRNLADQGFRGPFAVADGRIVHNAGGSEAQELAFAIAAAVDCLRALEAGGVPLDSARGMIYFRLAADADEFLTIAKFRAIRKLWARVEAACGVAPKPTTVAAETAWRMMTQRDPYVNMLRTTIAVTAAGLGGADNIAALPHTAALGLPDAFARRVARNTQLILLEESNLAKVADPAAGSGAIEDLTAKLCAAAWALFQQFDKAGGAWAALEKRLAADAKSRRCASGAKPMPRAARMRSPAPAIIPISRNCRLQCSTLRRSFRRRRPELPLWSNRCRVSGWPNRSRRCATSRIAVLEKDRRRPKVFLANLGKLSDFTARAMFAKNFYEAGGIEALGNDGFKDQAEMIAAFKASGAKLACLCSSDKVYAAQAADAAKALSAAGAVVHLAGRPGENEANWRQAGVKSFVFMGCDVVSTLQAAHDILGVK